MDHGQKASRSGRNIVICADGTGNTFDGNVTNVVRLVACLALGDSRRQVVVYDQGVGTSAARVDAVESFRRDAPDPGALRLLPPPLPSRLPPRTALNRARGLLFGYGLRQNIREMYRELATLYAGPDDRVFLLGFSRGAFTVRALAGLLHRCGLPPSGAEDVDARFDRAWTLYQPMRGDASAVQQFRSEQRLCPIHFMGLWDTVKSYGELDPVILPHLRHNPIVAHVRHALALDERRAWFKPTTWGRLDLDRDYAMTRLPEDDLRLLQDQDIAEVWFAGCHSDVGGGVQGADTPRIALRWMLGEAVNVVPGLRPSDAGVALLAEDDPPGPPVIHESWNRRWRWVEQLPRREIDNGGVYPVKKASRGSDGQRAVAALGRGGTVCLHTSVERAGALSGGQAAATKIEYRPTRKAPREKNDGSDGTRTRDLRIDSPAL